MFKFALISDVHIDRKWLDPQSIVADLPDDCKTIVVAGDISDNHVNTMDWLGNLKNNIDKVIWVPGNHDFYSFNNSNYPRLVNEIQDYYQNMSKMFEIVYLNRSTYQHNGITFIGATGWHDFVAGEPFSTTDQIDMWSKIDESFVIEWNYNNPKTIDRADDVLNEAMKDFTYISETIKTVDGPVVVVTHHLPHRKLCIQRPENIHWTKLHGMFANTMFETVSDEKIKYWCYGHTHFRSMKTINGMTYVCNPKGYKGENPSWVPIVLDV